MSLCAFYRADAHLSRLEVTGASVQGQRFAQFTMRAAFARRNVRARRAKRVGNRNRSLAAKNLVARHRELLDLLTPVQVSWRWQRQTKRQAHVSPPWPQMEYLETQFLEFADDKTQLLPAKQLAPLLRHLGDHITALETKQ